MPPIQLSVVIITRNEESNIERCIGSVLGIADEVIVLDSGSEDKTRELAEALGAKVYQRTFTGHIEQKNAAISLASFPHILSLDADEALDAELADAVKKVKLNFSSDGYYLNRLTSYAGQWLRHGGWYPDRKLRLWDSRKGKWGGVNPHDRFGLEAGCSTEQLPGHLLHYSYSSREEHRQQSRRFAETAAKALFSAGKKAGWIKRFLSPLFRFLYSYFFRLGFLEGAAGYYVASISAWASYHKYRRLHQLHLDQKNNAAGRS